jgi:hypothetical protein
MNRILLAAVVLSALAFAQTTVKADQGRPGTQGPWPVTITGGLSLDGGSINVTTAPCSNIVMTNDAGIGTSPSRVPVNGGTAGREWIRICNDIGNSSSTICKCSTGQFCPATTAAGSVGDAIATGDCVTYNVGYGDGGTPCCVCNGAGSFLPAAECIP